MVGKAQTYAPLKPSLAIQLAAPHTWAASVSPVLLAVVLAIISAKEISITLTLALLSISVLMQSAVNTLNDYYDFTKGADSEENQLDPSDAVLVYHQLNPRSVLVLAITFLVVALGLGVYVIYCAGWIPLVIGIIGALIIIIYSAGKTPLSYLPIGELASGITMGCLIPLASFQALTLTFEPALFYFSLPFVLGIALIMFTNNTCDREKDIIAGRKTLSVILGRKKAITLYRSIIVFWVIAIIALLGIFFTAGLLVLPFMLLIAYPTFSLLWKNPFTLQSRIQAMSLCLNANNILGLFYLMGIAFSSVVVIL